MRDVERVQLEDPAALARRLEEGEAPLVIVGGAASWPATRWSPAYLCELLGPIEIEFKVSSSNAHPDLRQRELARMFARERAPLADLLRRIGAGTPNERSRQLFTGDERFLLRRRAGHTEIDPQLAPLLGDIETPALFSPDRLHTIWAWLSGPGVRTWLHYDNNGCHNLNAQLTGRKRCVLYPPEALPLLHVFPLGGENPAHNLSRIDVERPTPEHAVDLAAAPAFQAELAAGDMLFIPAWWLHTFLHEGELNTNVNFWWRPERPRSNVVAARQALVDAARDAGLGSRDAAAAALLGALDAAIQRREPA